MFKTFTLAALLAVSAWVALPTHVHAAAKCERLIATGSAEFPPYVWRDPHNPERLMGVTVELLKQLGQELGIEIDVIYTGPWSRALDEVRTGRVDMLAGAYLTLDRLEQMDFIHPPAVITDNVLWVPADSELVYEGWSDLTGLKGDKLLGNSLGQSFDEYAQDNLSLEEVASITQAFQKLLHNRTDYVIYGRQPGEAFAHSIGSADELKALAPAVSYEGLYLTVSHKSACNNAWLRGQLARKMTKLLSAGVPEQLLQSNQQVWKSQQAPSDAAGELNQ